MPHEQIDIVGGGLVGTLAAIYLAQRGFPVVVHERRSDMRKVEVAAGRSINLAVTSRGLAALEQVGLKDDILKIAIPMKGRMLHSLAGETQFVPYGQREHEVIYSVSRGLLNKRLLELAGRYENVRIEFNRRCTEYDLNANTLTFCNEVTDREETIAVNIVLGADGSGSVLRKAMLENVRNFNYSQEFLDHGYKELVVPAGDAGAFRLEPKALHIWPRKSFMLIALPNLDGSFTCTFFFAHEGAESFAALRSEADVISFFQNVFPDAAAMMPTVADDFFRNPTGSMVTVKCRPWRVGHQLMLIGDAAHAIVPFFGQGMNCGFEDCVALGRLLDEQAASRKSGAANEVDWQHLFARLENERRPNADAIADMAVENFVEMRDTVADAKFLLKKQVGFELERRYPGRFIPRYSMVVFHPEIPYSEARRRGEAQDKILEALTAGAAFYEQIDWSTADRLMTSFD